MGLYLFELLVLQDVQGIPFQVLQRMGLVPQKADTARAYAAIMSAMPSEWSAADYDEHHLLMKEIGRAFCRPASMACGECPAQALCGTGRARAG